MAPTNAGLVHFYAQSRSASITELETIDSWQQRLKFIFVRSRYLTIISCLPVITANSQETGYDLKMKIDISIEGLLN